MLQRLVFILLVLAPMLVAGQSSPADRSDCDKTFTKSEELPSLKVSKQAFEDSLTACLKANQAFDAGGKFVLQFVLTKESRMLELEKIGGSNPTPGFMKCFGQFSQLWVPAVQNKRPVCAYVKCEIEVKQDRLSVRIFQ
jgi:hypothetical protein